MLPKIDAPIVEIEIPSTGRTSQFRPFTVKEEKILLLAKQDGSNGQMISSISQIVRNCSLQDLDVDKMTYFDVESIFIKLRVISVGNVIEYKYDGKDARVDLEDVKIRGEIKKKPGSVKLNDNTAAVMRYPTMSEVAGLDEEPEELMTEVVRICISRIVVGEDDVTDFTNYDVDEQREWIESLTATQYQHFRDFFGALPAVVVESKYKEADGTIQTNELKGLRNFF